MEPVEYGSVAYSTRTEEHAMVSLVEATLYKSQIGSIPTRNPKEAL